MADWQQVLRDTHPDPLGADDAAGIRRAMVETARAAAAAPHMRRAPVMIIGGALLTAVTAGVFVTTSQPTVEQPVPALTSPAVRQLQFATPSGTRIIWQFNPEFTLRETLP